jgi:hypothetical protein
MLGIKEGVAESIDLVAVQLIATILVSADNNRNVAKRAGMFMVILLFTKNRIYMNTPFAYLRFHITTGQAWIKTHYAEKCSSQENCLKTR